MDSQNERQRYIQKVSDNLYQAAMSKRFVDSDEGKYLLDYITEVVSALTNKIVGSRLERDDYIETRAKIDILIRLKQILEVKADDAAIAKLQKDLELAQSGE